MRSRFVLSEAWRNTASGASRAVTFALMAGAIMSVMVLIDLRGMINLLSDANDFLASGGATVVVSAENAIDGKACDSLSDVEGVVAAGALRSAPVQLRFSALPASPISTFEVTPRFSSVVGAKMTGAGILVVDSLLPGIRTGSTVATSAGPARLAGTYAYPDDGRIPTLGNGLLVPVNDRASFDQCWVTVWPPSRALAELPRTVVAPSTPENSISVTQLNATRGAEFDGPARAASRTERAVPAILFTLMLVLVWVSVWIRRAELASAQHAGVTRRAQFVQNLIELMAWLAVATAIGGVATVLGSSLGNPWDPLGVALFGLWDLLAGFAGGLLGCIGASIAIREQSLFSYFKNRG